MKQADNRAPLTNILLLILAGEGIFLLPFVLARIFRPSFLAVFSLDNFQLGICFSVYGIVAMASYLFGGFVADLFPSRKLISIALALTAAGGIYMSTFPSFMGMKILFGYWGFTTIFLFWAAMIKATRTWGGTTNQAKAFGLLEGGRGLFAALLGTVGVAIFAIFLPLDVENLSDADRQSSFRMVILLTSVLVFLISVAVLLFLKEEDHKERSEQGEKRFANLFTVVKIPSVWMLMVIILCAYVGYKVTGIFSLYAKEIMLYDELKASKIGLFLIYIRPIVGISLGFLANRTSLSYCMIGGFFLVILGCGIFISGVVAPNVSLLFLLSILITAIGIYSIRTLYFALMAEGKIPLQYTGTAVGLISVVGYTPDIFVGPIMGKLLDNSPGLTGHIHTFMLLAAFSLCGLVFSILFYFYAKKKARYEESNTI